MQYQERYLDPNSSFFYILLSELYAKNHFLNKNSILQPLVAPFDINLLSLICIILVWPIPRCAQSINWAHKYNVMHVFISEFLSLLLSQSDNFLETNIIFFQASPLWFYSLVPHYCGSGRGQT